MYKSKWHLLILDYRRITDYKRITDYHARTDTQSNREHVDEGLPRSFLHEVYCCIHEWFGKHSQIQPPHIRDLLHLRDSNYVVDKHTSDDDVEVVDKNLSQEADDSVDIGKSSTPLSKNWLGKVGSGKGISTSFEKAMPMHNSIRKVRSLLVSSDYRG
jgi:hypothetical protein